ncbi:glycosyltransferase [Pseudogemmobacter sonorensis]|uniref:glycosyltransferase n=1 Tax=Pseudogemmobacter sonorensis TaxID=2989681 RepID=UPI0036B60151
MRQILSLYDRLAALHLETGADGSHPMGKAEALAPKTWFYGNASDFRAGMFEKLPDITGRRQLEGGMRLTGKPERREGPLVSIVTAVWNNAVTLQRCIDSVRAQSWGNIEHIIIDGGSDEPTLDVIRANADHLAYFVSEPDGGIYSAMNKGIAAAQGDYICLLNSDDMYDPEFVSRTLARAQEAGGEVIVHTDYFADKTPLPTMPINEGILFGHLHICHNTFLAPRACYDRVGPYDEGYRIVSDAVWMRRAFLMGEPFLPLAQPLFTLSSGGLSSGTSEAHRKLFIGEVVRSYRQLFPGITEADAEAIYMFRFNKARTAALHDVAMKYHDQPAVLGALRRYAEHCMRDRGNFRLKAAEAVTVFPDFIRLADLLHMDRRCFQIETKAGPLSEILGRIEAILSRRKPSARKTILHFITVFSAPSETFVYDLLSRLEAEPDLDSFILFEHAQLREERPFDKAIQVFWNDFPEIIAGQIYKHIVERLKPDLVIGHFALNEWKWAQRSRSLGIEIPTISMCHGIDAFSLRDKQDYRQHVVERFSRRPDTAFTAVSGYLRQELLANGVPESRIQLLHNVVNDRFFAHRKTGGYYDHSRTLKLLSIGRLIDWKGHRFLIDALDRFRKTCTPDVHLTIVYGNGADELESLKAQVSSLGLGAHVSFVPFVDFSAEPGFMAGFDLFVHPSTYSSGPVVKSETFGVALLEAIAAGLPVITTDAGGLPEVIGDEKRFARIVPHADAGALAGALADMWRDGSTFADNRAYAEERLERFSADAQMAGLRALIDKVTAPRIRAALFSSSTIQGAGYAAFRVHRGLRETTVVPHMFTTVRNHESEPDVTVIRHPSGDNANWRRLQGPPKPGLTIFTINDDHIPNADLLRMVEPYDVINLHWHARFLSLENIAALTRSGKPVVMTIRDMMPITGGCHFFHGCDRWRQDCRNCSQLAPDHADYPSTVLAMKRACYDFSNLTLVAISNHSSRILAQAPLFRDCRIEVIPNSIETDVFRPYDRMARRKEFGLPLDRKIIGYVPSFSSEVKGYREIVAAMKLLDTKAMGGDPFVMLVGNETPATASIPFDKKALGYISDNNKLARAYSCADVVVVPSLEETFSNTAAEAIACGVPVVGFKTGAIPDLAVDGKTGYTFEVGDVPGLARGIAQVLTGRSMKAACRAHAEEMLAFPTQARRYEALFRELAAKTGGLRRD